MRRPANILLTAAEPPVPVLVDFGFAEKYDARSSKAFLSNLAYGTPEVCMHHVITTVRYRFIFACSISRQNVPEVSHMTHEKVMSGVSV